ncbi:MAG: NAD-dependent deacylase [Anaerolineae bacterium]|nr:NAD-dependent deacylase [Anaerolineae bacterium]
MSIALAAELIKNSQHTVVLTGAGISTPSGIPDFRSNKDGLWNRVNPMEVASLTAFRLHPEKFFAWIQPLLITILQAEPNAAHFALARLEQAGMVHATITQNIDGLHQKAGSNIVYEIHGALDTLTCGACYLQHQADDFVQSFIHNGSIPLCTSCGNILKPNVILFEEQLPIRVWQQSEKAIRECDLLLVAGSSLEVIPVAGLPMGAINAGAKLIIINQSPTYIDERADVLLDKDVAEVIPLIADEILNN